MIPMKMMIRGKMMTMKKMTFESTVHVQRFVLGVICGLLPILCTLFGVISINVGGDDISTIYSISATYYSQHKIIMIGTLWLCSFFLFTYKGYDLGDRIFTILAGIGAFGVSAFPCAVDLYTDRVGLFSLSMNVSNVIHSISAGLVFGSFTLMTLTQFTKGKRKKRNVCYYVCSGIMAVGILLVILKNIFGWVEFTIMIFEAIMLEAFAVAWIVKSGAFTYNKETQQ